MYGYVPIAKYVLPKFVCVHIIMLIAFSVYVYVCVFMTRLNHLAFAGKPSTFLDKIEVAEQERGAPSVCGVVFKGGETVT